MTDPSRSVSVALMVTIALQAALQIERLPNIWMNDIRFYTSILLLLSLGVIFAVQYFEHARSRNPNGIALFYWVFFIIAHGVKLRSLVARETFNDHLPFFVVFSASLGLGVVEFILEYLVP